MRSLVRKRRVAAGLPRDPAPSRLGYRYQRLMLTPGFRASVRIGVPLVLIATLAGSWLAKPENRLLLDTQITQAKQQFQERPQFMVQKVQFSGGDAALQASAADLIAIDFPVSSFDLDFEQIRTTVEALDPVKSVRVRVGQGGALDITITPRLPVAVWRDGQTLRLIDKDGVQAGITAARSDHSALPLIAGDGAEEKINEALALYARTGPLQDRVRGLVRIGERRWDIVFDRAQRLMLPGDDAIAALDRVIALNSAQDMLERDVAVVDMRNANRPTLRMTEEAASAQRRASQINLTDGARN